MKLDGSLLLAITLVAAGTVSSHVDYVYGYNGYADAYRIITAGGRAEAVAPFAPLHNGERVEVLRASDKSGKPTAIVVSVNGTRYTVTYANTPFCIGRVDGKCNESMAASIGQAVANNKVVHVLGSILASIAPIFGQAHDDAYSAQVDQMVARGEASAPAIPMLAGSPMALEPVSSRTLAFGWLGGRPPFVVTVTSASGQAFAHKSGVTDNGVAIDGLHFAPGTYRVQIVDAAQQTVSGAFHCINSGLPALPIDDISGDVALPPVAIGTIRAGLLARRGRQWYLAAYQVLAPLPDDAPDGQVHNLRYWLSEGLPPPT